MATMADLGVTGLLELPPAGTLVGLAKRALPGVETVRFKTPDDLPAALDLIARHGSASPTSQAPTWRLLVAPGQGHVPPGGHVGGRRGCSSPAPWSAPSSPCATSSRWWPRTAAHVVEWLVEDGDPVSPGQPIVRLHPEAVP
jgi:[acyl-carrier-protein] S-malonyltransferase